MHAIVDAILSALGAAAVGILGWIYNANAKLTSRVSDIDVRTQLLEQKHVDLKELINTRFDAQDDRLERIEQALNGAFHRG